MGELRRVDTGSGLYERLLHRLALALDEEDTATRLRDEEPPKQHLSALALSAYARPMDVADAIAAGFDLHMGKPFEAVELMNTVARLVRERA